jgi:hypothetical protein
VVKDSGEICSGSASRKPNRRLPRKWNGLKIPSVVKKVKISLGQREHCLGAMGRCI